MKYELNKLFEIQKSLKGQELLAIKKLHYEQV